MPGHGGIRTYDLWNTSPMLFQLSYAVRSYSNRPDRVAQLEEHWASIPKVVGSNPAVARHIFHACPVWIYTQSNITQESVICLLRMTQISHIPKFVFGPLVVLH